MKTTGYNRTFATVALSCLFCILLSFIGNAQARQVTITCHLVYGDCGHKAIKVFGNTAQVDTCFDSKNNVFTIDKTGLAQNTEIYTEVLGISKDQWKQIEADLNKVTGCDFAMDYIVHLTEKGKTYTFSLKRFMNCYPTSGKKVMEGLDKYFESIQ